MMDWLDVGQVLVLVCGQYFMVFALEVAWTENE